MAGASVLRTGVARSPRLRCAEGTATTVLAQGTPDSRVAASVTGGYRSPQPTFSQSVTFEQYSEPGSLTTTYTQERRPIADFGATVRVWRNFGVGVSGSHSDDSGTAQVHALVPHPFVFNQPREVNGPADVTSIESAVHVQAAYWAQLTPRLDLIMSGGPVLFSRRAGLRDRRRLYGVSPLRHGHVPGGDGRAAAAIGDWRQHRWRSGLAPCPSHRPRGCGSLFSRATADFPGTSATPVPVGGFHVGGGVRLLF